MCGRYASTATDEDLLALFEIAEVADPAPPPSWNVAPTASVRVVLERVRADDQAAGPVRLLHTARWGLVPSWAKDLAGGARLINARSETVTEKPAFRRAAGRRRCLLPADGYYEWETRDGRKVPQFLHGDGVLALAGLYEWWRPDADSPWVLSATVLTRPATDALGHIHDRSPVVLPAGLQGEWLDPRTTDLVAVRELLDSVPEPRLEPREVSAAVGNVRNDGPELVRPV